MNDLPYRQGVNAIVMDNDNNFLIVQKINYRKNEWAFPGGGLEEGEDIKTGILRELNEELGTSAFEIIKLSPIILKFEWPKEAQERGFKTHGKSWRGQEEHQFIVRFAGNRNDIKLQENEIRKVKWVKYSELKNHLIFDGQWENVEKVIKEAGFFPE